MADPMAAWLALTMGITAPAAPPPPSGAGAGEWSALTRTAPSPTTRALEAPAFGGYGTAGPRNMTGLSGHAGGAVDRSANTAYPAATTPLLDSPTEVPQGPEAKTFDRDLPTPTDEEALRAATEVAGPRIPATTATQRPPPPLSQRDQAEVSADPTLQAAQALGYDVRAYLRARRGITTPSGILPEGYKPVWEESFDDGTGILSLTWGNVDTSVPGQITVRSAGDGSESGAMMPWGDASSGFGYGLYSFEASFNAQDPGAYLLLWPGDNRDQEIDVAEINPAGQLYATNHNGHGTGNHTYSSRDIQGINAGEVNLYQMHWTEGQMTLFVNGEQKATWTEGVPVPYDQGGRNFVPGIGMETGHFAQSGAPNEMTVYSVSYSAEQ